MTRRVWLVRHGETEWSRDGRHTSHTDLPLTARGEDEARALAGVLASVAFDLVLVSPRERATAHDRKGLHSGICRPLPRAY